MRKKLKKLARGRLKKNYWLLVVLCLILAVAGIDYKNTMTSIGTDTSSSSDTEETVQESIMSKVISDIIIGKDTKSVQEAKEYIEQKKEQTGKVGIIAVGHSRGVLAQLVNGVSSGDVMNSLYQVLKNITNSKSLSIAFFIILSLLFYAFVKIFIMNVFRVLVKRITMELRFYDKVPLSRFLYLIRVKQLVNVALTMLLEGVYSALWSLTIIGPLIKSRSYQMVPYIIAENPSIKPNQAITLSRKMMNGHKWEAFKLDFSFIGWSILEFLTYGITGFLYSNPYKEFTHAEYYNHIRALAKENNVPGVEMLNDEYLYVKADKELLVGTYSDVQEILSQADGPAIKHTGFRGFMENIFGLTFAYDDDEKAYQDKKAKQQATVEFRQIMEQNMYPFRLFTLDNKKRGVKLSSVQFDRHYSIFSVILIFFSLSFVGWCWEVSLHLLSDGKFVNRGVMYGPWLPIYGFGCVLILVVLNKFRSKPFVEFIAGIVLCGFVEYTSAWYLELTNDGTKWWDYTGYFLNLHGRICAEGLLVFGLGGIVIVYLLAPFLDNHLRKLPTEVLIMVAVLLLCMFFCDSRYSAKHPNAGDGITNYSACITDPGDLILSESIHV